MPDIWWYCRFKNDRYLKGFYSALLFFFLISLIFVKSKHNIYRTIVFLINRLRLSYSINNIYHDILIYFFDWFANNFKMKIVGFDIILNYMLLIFYFFYNKTIFKRSKLFWKKKCFPYPFFCSYVIFFSFHQKIYQTVYIRVCIYSDCSMTIDKFYNTVRYVSLSVFCWEYFR